MEKTFNPNAIEQAMYQHWESQGYFKPSGDTSNGSYCIVIPPPNVTGSLHMGHAFQQTIMDALIRYQRMLGKNTLWQVGTDHATIMAVMPSSTRSGSGKKNPVAPSPVRCVVWARQ